MAKSQQEDPFIGTRIREYEILDVIGHGGMGNVYRARHILLEEERAVKVIQSRLAGDKGFVARFVREARILTKLRHPNLVQLFEFGTLKKDDFFMVLEYLKGESVLARLRRTHTIPFGEAAKIIREAALGLHSAHQKGIVHRDISPDNLFIVRDDTGAEVTKVIDFGIAKPNFDVTPMTELTGVNLFIGKPEYGSPEQCGIMEEGEVIDRRSDIYSLGITFYYMITGKLPFNSSSGHGYMHKHIHESPKPPSSHFPEGQLSQKLDALILKMLEKKRADRFNSMDELVRSLDQIFDPGGSNASARTTETPITEFLPGDLFNRRYMIQSRLGEGGFGSVYKAIDNLIGVPVALKILNPKVVQTQSDVDRFKREVILARRVAHPNVCRIYDIGESHSIHYVSMEILSGTTLCEMIRQQGALDPTVGVPIIRQILEGLSEAHREGITHRDLKPQNIMVDLNMKASIMDFGISISTDALLRVTKIGSAMGTPHYMAPEQCEGQSVDQRADIYSMGVIMYEVFTGRLPFVGDTPLQVMLAHLKSVPQKPTELIPELPGELEQVILKALEKAPQNRYQSVQDLLRALQPLFASSMSGPMAIPREALAHKLIAEGSYSRAIKYMKVLLRTNPDNADWKKLLNIALSGKTQRNLHRVKSLIRKKNLIQAQLLIEQLQRLNVENAEGIRQVKKLSKVLSQKKEKAFAAYVIEAGDFLQKQDLAKAMQLMEAAANLLPNDPRLAELENRLLRMQEQKVREDLLPRISEIEKAAFGACESSDEAIRKCDAGLQAIGEILLELPEFEPALSLQTTLKRMKQETSKREIPTAADVQPGSTLRIEANPVNQIGKNEPSHVLEGWDFDQRIAKGEELFRLGRWEDALMMWNKASTMLPEDRNVKEKIVSLEQKISEENACRAELRGILDKAEADMARNLHAEADRSLKSAQDRFNNEYRLKDLQKRFSAIQDDLNDHVEKLKQKTPHSSITPVISDEVPADTSDAADAPSLGFITRTRRGWKIAHTVSLILLLLLVGGSVLGFNASKKVLPALEEGLLNQPDNPRKMNIAVKVFRLACALGNSRGCADLGNVLIMGGSGLKPGDSKKGLELIRSACAAANARGCYYLGEELYHSKKRDEQLRGLGLFEKACNEGERDACYTLGWWLHFPDYVDSDRTKALKYFARACDLGSMSSCVELADMYWWGGSSFDKQRAEKLFSKACDGDSLLGCQKLGDTVYDDRDDVEKVKLLYENMCEKDDYNCILIGKLHEGWGEDEEESSYNNSRAIALLQKACNADNLQGCYELANMYEDMEDKRAEPLYSHLCHDYFFSDACESLGE